MQNISPFIEEFRAELNRQCLAFDGTWVKRMRKLNTATMFSSIIYMLAQRSCNFKSLSTLISLNGDSGPQFSASSFSEARRKFPPYLFVDLSQWIYSFVDQKLKSGKWFARHVFAVDSTTITLPRELADEGFGHEETGAFYPTATLTTIYDLRLGMIYDSIISQHRSERANASQLFKGIPEGALVIGDRGFFSFEMLHEARKNKIDVLFRIARAHAPEEVRELADQAFRSEVVTITPSIPTQSKLLSHGFSTEPLEVKILKSRIAGNEYILITTILDESIKTKDFLKLYGTRWDIEESFKLLKSELNLESFKSKHLNGILQEIFATIFIANFSEALARLHLGAKTKTIKRVVVSTLTIVRIVRDSFISIIRCSKARLTAIAKSIACGIEKACSKFRPGRSYPRNFWDEVSPWTKYAKGVRC